VVRDSSQEFLDLFENRRHVPSGDDVIGTGQLNVARARYVVGQVSRAFDVESVLADAVHDQRRCSDRRQHIPHIDFVSHLIDGVDVARARALPPTSGEGALGLVVCTGGEGLDRPLHCLEIVPVPEELLVLFPRLLLSQAPGIVGSPHIAWERTPEDERQGPLGIRSREEQRQRAALGRAQERGLRGADRIHHRTDVIHAGLECGNADPVRHSRATLIESDQAAETRKPTIEGRQGRHLPGELDVRDEALDPD
jgi:hypothetical protein